MSQPPPEHRFVTPDQTGAMVDVREAFRLVLALLALWTLFSGISLVLLQGLGSVTLAGALHDPAAQRLLGVHVLLLAAVYVVMAWQPERLRPLLWVPYAHQFGIAVATAYDLLRRHRDIQDGAVPLMVAIIFLALLVYLFVRAQESQSPLAGFPEPKSLPAPPSEAPPSASD